MPVQEDILVNQNLWVNPSGSTNTKESLMLPLKQSGRKREERGLSKMKTMTARMKMRIKNLSLIQNDSRRSKNSCLMYTELEPARISSPSLSLLTSSSKPATRLKRTNRVDQHSETNCLCDVKNDNKHETLPLKRQILLAKILFKF